MKATILLSVAALALTTGFTCSKNTPAPEAAPAATEATAPAAEAAPADAAAAAPAEGTTTETTTPETH